MNKSEFRVYLKQQTSIAESRISLKGSRSDKVDSGRVKFLTVLSRVVDGNASPEDLGVVGVVNDVLQKLALLPSGKTFLSVLEP
ncbi:MULTISPECIES: hypothetical protein [Pseudomonas]|jgi:hypothetical protein|uniref:Uncharacterized protein n=1 Tax=Pseudomonas veronii TaxID=76761 RepID=A0A4P7Y9X7_PSEVE|nr:MULTISPECIES: hypothetical protein [Pseudomonas]MBI6552454.1 hypothetical protein [Pseudomonas veronii]MBI6652276.1 hypothetical protein [Pseudomonas veronii]MBJ2181253.1 hypothetical protein [Pseudomonas veronii]MDY7552528.1 hypothetical protein [Pseudomonas sp. FG1]MEB0054694.1 hypothetical protein [Pseudomonas sp. FG1]